VRLSVAEANRDQADPFRSRLGYRAGGQPPLGVGPPRPGWKIPVPPDKGRTAGPPLQRPSTIRGGTRAAPTSVAGSPAGVAGLTGALPADAQ
jgi:hypothetical protein